MDTDMEVLDLETGASPDTRKDLLSQQFDEVAAAPVVDTPSVTTPRVRDDRGKFAVNAPPATGATKVAPPTSTPSASPVASEPVWKRAPKSWSATMHEAWNTAPAKFQEYAHKREDDMRAGYEQVKTKAEFADQIQSIVDPYMPTIRGLGLDAPRAVKALMEADHALRYSSPAEKHALFVRLAQTYGVNLGDIANGPQPTAIDPNVYALQNELNNVRGEVQSWKEMQAQAQHQELANEIHTFAQANPNFEAARPKMAVLLHHNQAGTLQEAYDLVTDEWRKALGVATTPSAGVSQRADRQAKSARAAAVSVRSSTPGVQSVSKAADRRSLLSEQFDSINSRM